MDLDTDVTSLMYSDGFCAEKRKTSGQRATYEYLRGKVLDVFPDYKKKQRIVSLKLRCRVERMAVAAPEQLNAFEVRAWESRSMDLGTYGMFCFKRVNNNTFITASKKRYYSTVTLTIYTANRFYYIFQSNMRKWKGKHTLTLSAATKILTKQRSKLHLIERRRQ